MYGESKNLLSFPGVLNFEDTFLHKHVNILHIQLTTEFKINIYLNNIIICTCKRVRVKNFFMII